MCAAIKTRPCTKRNSDKSVGAAWSMKLMSFPADPSAFFCSLVHLLSPVRSTWISRGCGSSSVRPEPLTRRQSPRLQWQAQANLSHSIPEWEKKEVSLLKSVASTAPDTWNHLLPMWKSRIPSASTWPQVKEHLSRRCPLLLGQTTEWSSSM